MKTHQLIMSTLPIAFMGADQRVVTGVWPDLLIFAVLPGLVLGIMHLRARLHHLHHKLNTIEHQLGDTQGLLQLLSHDLAGPLFVIQSVADLQCERIKEDGKIRQQFEKIRGLAQSAQAILKIVKELEAIEAGKIDLLLKPVSLRASLESTLDVLTPMAAGKAVKLCLETDVPPELKVVGERTVLEHTIFHNVLANAIKFSQAGDRIEIRVEGHHEGEVAIRIKDHGIGIPGPIITQLFTHNGKTSRRGTQGEKGTGLGLPLAGRYVRKFGGRIEVASQAREEHPNDHWTEFKVTLKKAG